VSDANDKASPIDYRSPQTKPAPSSLVSEPEYVRRRERRGCVVSLIVGLIATAGCIWLLHKLASAFYVRQ